MNTFERSRLAILVVLALAGFSGCSLSQDGGWKPSKLFSLNNAWPWNDDDEPKVEVPNRIVGLWTDTVLHKAGQTPQRGFGGRLLFYGKDPNKPVLVDGELVVYAFDESGRELTDNKPTRRYVFPADQIPVHQSAAPVGPSYSFWLPWDEAGGPQTEVSLICRFEAKGGTVVTSEQTRHQLPGALGLGEIASAHAPPRLPEGVPSRPAVPRLPGPSGSPPVAGGTRLVSYESPVASIAPQAAAGVAADAAALPSSLTTTTIALPGNFQMPNNSARVPAGATSAPPRQFVPAAQPPAAASSGQPSATIAAPSVSPAAGTYPANSTTQSGWTITAYVPPVQPVAPVAYNPTYAAPPAQGIQQRMQMPAQAHIAPPVVSPPSALSPSQLMQQVQQQTVQHAMQQPTGGQPTGWSQAAQQAMQTPTSGAATVIYR